MSRLKYVDEGELDRTKGDILDDIKDILVEAVDELLYNDADPHEIQRKLMDLGEELEKNNMFYPGNFFYLKPLWRLEDESEFEQQSNRLVASYCFRFTGKDLVCLKRMIDSAYGKIIDDHSFSFIMECLPEFFMRAKIHFDSIHLYPELTKAIRSGEVTIHTMKWHSTDTENRIELKTIQDRITRFLSQMNEEERAEYSRKIREVIR